MKIHGKSLSGPRIEVIVFPRQDGNIVFKAQAVLDSDDFEKVLPRPTPPVRLLPGGISSENKDNPDYVEAFDKWATIKWDWMFLKSLQATPGLEWESVKMDDPETYENYRQEMKDSGISYAEIARLQNLVTDACGLNQDKIDQATRAFLATEGEAQKLESSPVIEASSMPSGEPVSASK